jgi:hypothetical protein
VKKARALPIPVDKPAKSVSPNANQKFPDSIKELFSWPFFLFSRL